MKKEIIDDIDIAKILLDPKRKKILKAATDVPLTVSQIAKKLNEKPSRLYYHVKKLEEIDMLKLVETRQQGNLLEKYYQSNLSSRSFEIENGLLIKNYNLLLENYAQLINSGLTKLTDSYKNPDKETASISVAYSKHTNQQWVKTKYEMLSVIEQSIQYNKIPSEELPDDHKEKEDYVYILLSYKLTDKD
ncbi:winged helix-turn-helix domain-containing protein [Cytobacillus firmus]|uniref:winged helix-turn-helix domain-containing protein n=1 Tax=Cytobacillus firmus TaxID=1399 RepID=UPI0018CC9DAF|nr:winged helix-turn-helix domain-containing protein [Cytobacillus firmus]